MSIPKSNLGVKYHSHRGSNLNGHVIQYTEFDIANKYRVQMDFIHARAIVKNVNGVLRLIKIVDQDYQDNDTRDILITTWTRSPQVSTFILANYLETSLRLVPIDRNYMDWTSTYMHDLSGIDQSFSECRVWIKSRDVSCLDQHGEIAKAQLFNRTR